MTAERTEQAGPAAEDSPSRAPELNRQLHILLDDKPASRLEQHQKTDGERLILAQYRHELRMGDIALPDDTAKALFQIICEEKARTPPLPFDPRTENGDMCGKAWKAIMRSDTRKLKPISVGAFSVEPLGLDEEQYQALAKFQDRHLAAEKAGIEALRLVMQQSQRESDASP